MSGLVRCTACGAQAHGIWQSSDGAVAARGARRVWNGSDLPVTFTIERWTRGGQPRVIASGPFPGWPELVELARELCR